MMRFFLFLLLTVIFVSDEVFSWRNFHHGRKVGGILNILKNTGNAKDFPDEWFTQNLDHFNPNDERTFQQRYFTNDQFYKDGGPVFVQLGEEGVISTEWMTQGAWVTYGQQYGALLFLVEHRYYGDSHPTEDMSTANLQYLTSQQAIADIATFIIAMNAKYNLTSDVKWIAFGGSYSASLAAWLRFKYPHLVHGAVSSSGPILAKADFFDFFRVVQESLATHSDDCVTAIGEGVSTIATMLKQSVGQDNVNQLFKLCTPIQDSLDNSADLALFYWTIAANFAQVVQYNKINYETIDSNFTIDYVCDVMVDESIGGPVYRLAQVNDYILNTYMEECLDYKYDKMIDFHQEVSWDSDAAAGGRQWVYQTCTEFGFYQTSSYEPHIFGTSFPIEFFTQQCTDIYGDLYDADFLSNAVDRTNIIYGGLDIEVTNVVFVHGSIDSWHALGIIETVNEEAPAIYINGTSHCADMFDAAETDLAELTAAREKIRDLIGSWLSQ